MKTRLMRNYAQTVPNVYLTPEDHDRLSQLVGDHPAEGTAALLRGELQRCIICDEEDLPLGAVGLNQWLHFQEGRGTSPRRVQVVLPEEENPDEGRISVLSWAGSGLIGLIEGHSIDWPDPAAGKRQLTPILVEDRAEMA